MKNRRSFHLNDNLLEELNMFLEHEKLTKAEWTIRNLRQYIRHFLNFLQTRYNINSVSQINYTMLYDFEQNDVHSGTCNLKGLNLSAVRHFIQYLASNGILQCGLAILMRLFTYKKGTVWRISNQGILDEINTYQQGKTLTPLCTYLHATNDIVHQMRIQNYSDSGIQPYVRLYDMLYVFLDENCLQFSLETAMIWIKAVYSSLGIYLQNSSNRAFQFLKEYLDCGFISFNRIYKFTPTTIDTLPPWCRSVVENYIALKQKEKLATSTITMHRIATCRFCKYIADKGLGSFSELTPDIVKQFNLSDDHDTIEGKNAYNVRIRMFLKYLASEKYIMNTSLYLALPTLCAKNENIVDILTNDEVSVLLDKLAPDNTELSLKDKAILLIGFRMGLRPIDIVNLTIDSIDWRKHTIKIIQKKTKVEVELPMPAEVGNAIYLYIAKERPYTTDQNRRIFVREKTAHDGYASISPCKQAIIRALPNIRVGSKFKILRKTHATELLRGGIGIERVAQLLGHSTTSATHKYVSLDGERMLKCAISFTDVGIPMWEG